jgi:hypothetical protein
MNWSAKMLKHGDLWWNATMVHRRRVRRAFKVKSVHELSAVVYDLTAVVYCI